jgi:putative ABC transport system permease protein
MRLFHALRARLRLLVAGRDAEARMNEEMRFHVEMEAGRLVRDEGLAPDEALRRARLDFGYAEKYKEEMRSARGPGWLRDRGGLSLDLTLALRMLAKYPGLSAVAVVGMAVAIAIGAGAFGVLGAMMDPEIPLPEGDRIVAIQNADMRNPGNPDRYVLHDYAQWRTRLTRVRDVGAFGDDDRTLVLPDGNAHLVSVAQMSASGFRVARVAPLRGRPLLESDERRDAPPVLVITEEQWQQRFGGDPAIIGRQVKLGRTEHTVVGVMPTGFRFPVHHQYWVPLRVDPVDHEPGAGPALYVFARLAPGATMEEAQAEVSAIRPANPQAPPSIRTVVLPFAYPFAELDEPMTVVIMRGVQLAVGLLLVVVAVNVAILVYARTASRAGEIAVRTALGASRRRVIAQLFAEAFVMCAVAAALGLATARAALAITMHALLDPNKAQLPFWVEFGLTPGIVLYTVALALVASVIVGVLPALKATGRNVQAGLKELSARGSRMELGRTWTALIVAQVALAVAVLPFAGYMSWQALQRGSATAAYPSDQILRAWVDMQPADGMPGDAPPSQATYALFVRRVEQLVRRLEAEPAVRSVTFASHFPGLESYAKIEAENGGLRVVKRSSVDADLLRDFDVNVVLGRPLAASDVQAVPRRVVAAGDTLTEDATVALANPALAEWLRETGPVIGRRIRRVQQIPDGAGGKRLLEGPWVEIVGVMPDFTVQTDFDAADAKFYTPASLASVAGGLWGPSVNIAVRVRGADAAAFAPRFRAVAAEVDPALQLHALRTAASFMRENQRALWLTGLAVAIATGSVLLLSAAGIYAMMSFTVARRRREIGIRAALGASARRVLGGIFARASAQLGTGVLVGVALAALVDRLAGGSVLAGQRLLLLPLAAGTMLIIGLCAALGPARRGLAVQPTEALREE